MFSKQEETPRVMATSRSASANMMFGDLPPSSVVTGVTLAAAACATAIPPRVDPVKDTWLTPGCLLSAEPVVGPSPCTMLKTPGGMPASSTTRANNAAHIGVTSLGFKTIVQPAARAANTLRAIWLGGQFHGVISPQTPIGSCLRSAISSNISSN